MAVWPYRQGTNETDAPGGIKKKSELSHRNRKWLLSIYKLPKHYRYERGEKKSVFTHLTQGIVNIINGLCRIILVMSDKTQKCNQIVSANACLADNVGDTVLQDSTNIPSDIFICESSNYRNWWAVYKEYTNILNSVSIKVVPFKQYCENILISENNFISKIFVIKTIISCKSVTPNPTDNTD